MAPRSKRGERKLREFESRSHRLEGCASGLSGTPAKREYWIKTQYRGSESLSLRYEEVFWVSRSTVEHPAVGRAEKPGNRTTPHPCST